MHPHRGAVCKVLFWAPASLFLSCVSPLQNLRSLSALETPGPGTVGHQGIPPPRSLPAGPSDRRVDVISVVRAGTYIMETLALPAQEAQLAS
uniref:Uncharacterized protein n=1 Tax=Coccidioides posadasii RMSCC 3488 TaxID=454284 RepID=A0A0J6F7E4_COCPO|nr:hypothetical protein CPAG_01201 [Coccidioides posadasii RMSCC 3488]